MLIKEKVDHLIIAFSMWYAQPCYVQLLCNTKPSLVATEVKSSCKSINSNASSDYKKYIKVSRMKRFWQGFRLIGFSIKVSKLMSKSRRPGTISYYKLAWRRFISCYVQKQIDPFCCSIENKVDILEERFDSGFEFHAIGSYRSASSVFHQNIDGASVV